MQQSFDLFFVSSNRHKFLEVKKILNSFEIKIGFYKSELEEIQSNSLKKIASKKAEQAFSQLKKPVIVEDDGLYITSLDGFPGPYSSYAFKTIGNSGILDLVKNNRDAKFVSIISFKNNNFSKSFKAEICGRISKKQKGKGWGYDPIFIPNLKSKTFAEISDKNKLSHRFKALTKFANWYLHMQQ